LTEVLLEDLTRSHVWVYIIAGTLISTEVWNRKGDHSQTAMPQRASYMLRHTRVRAKYKQQRQRCVLSQTTALRSIYSERVSGVTDDGDFSRTECLSILCCYCCWSMLLISLRPQLNFHHFTNRTSSTTTLMLSCARALTSPEPKLQDCMLALPTDKPTDGTPSHANNNCQPRIRQLPEPKR
jgi:hypothetical protein